MTVLTRKFTQFVPTNVTQVVGVTGGANSIGSNSGGGGGSGAVTQVITQANSFSVGQWVRFDLATNLYVAAQATTALNAEVIGVVIAVAPAGGPPYTQFTLQQSGYITTAQAVFPVLVPGQPYYLSDAVAGAMIPTDVLINGEVSRPVFIPDATAGGHSSGWVLPYRGIIVDGVGSPNIGPVPGGTDSNIVTINQNAHGLAAGDWVRIETPQAGPQVHYVKALADTLADSQAVGVVIQYIDPDNFRLQFAGYVATDAATSTTAPFQYVSAPGPVFSALVPKTVYYLSSTVPGQLTSIDPGLAGGGAFSKPLFVSEQTIGTVNRNAGYILPQRPLAAAVENNPLQKTITQNAHGFTMIGTVVKPSTVTPGAYVAAIATSFIPSYGTAMIVGIPDVNTLVLQEVGYVTGLDVAPPVPGGIANTATPMSIGQPYYLSTSNVPVSGQITNVEPVSPNFSKPMFMPDQTGAGWILPMKPTIGHGGGAGGGAWQLIRTINVNNGDTTITNLQNILDGTYTDVKFVGRNFVVQMTAPSVQYTILGLYYRVCIGGAPKSDAYYYPPQYQRVFGAFRGTALSLVPINGSSGAYASPNYPASWEMEILNVNQNGVVKSFCPSFRSGQPFLVSEVTIPPPGGIVMTMGEVNYYATSPSEAPQGGYSEIGSYAGDGGPITGIYFFLDMNNVVAGYAGHFVSGQISVYGRIV